MPPSFSDAMSEFFGSSDSMADFKGRGSHWMIYISDWNNYFIFMIIYLPWWYYLIFWKGFKVEYLSAHSLIKEMIGNKRRIIILTLIN